MKSANQLEKMPNVAVSAKDLLEVPKGTITIEGLRNSLNVSLIYLEAWLKGNGCVPIHNLMEDLATAEIARSQSKQRKFEFFVTASSTVVETWSESCGWNCGDEGIGEGYFAR